MLGLGIEKWKLVYAPMFRLFVIHERLGQEKLETTFLGSGFWAPRAEMNLESTSLALHCVQGV